MSSNFSDVFSTLTSYSASAPFAPSSQPGMLPDSFRSNTALGLGRFTVNRFDSSLNRIEGTAMNDDLKGAPLPDLVLGKQGNDVLQGRQGNDRISGGEGNDQINGGAHDDRLFGEQGSDRLQGSGGNDLLSGGSGNDTLRGGLGNDVLFGGRGNDRLLGQAGKDLFVISADYGVDIIQDFQKGKDQLTFAGGLTFSDVNVRQGTGGNQQDTLIRSNVSGNLLAILKQVPSQMLTQSDFFQSSSASPTIEVDRNTTPEFAPNSNEPFQNESLEEQTFNAETLNGDSVAGVVASKTQTPSNVDNNGALVANSFASKRRGERIGTNKNDKIVGGRANDVIRGRNGNDTLLGGNGRDRLWGEAGNDRLRGGRGNDILIGDNASSRGGHDTFVLARGEGTDTIKDFENGRDRIQLADGLTFDQLTISQRTGRNRRDTVLKEKATGKTLAILKGIRRSTITSDDFIESDSSSPTPRPTPNPRPQPTPLPGPRPQPNPQPAPKSVLDIMDRVVKFKPSDREAAIASKGGARIKIGTQTIYIGTNQVSSNNQNPIIASFDQRKPANNWVRTDYETTGADGRGFGLFYSGKELYAVFSVDGTQGTPSQDFRRASSDNSQQWTRSYGQGGGAKVSVIAKLDTATGKMQQAAYLSAVLSSGKTNSLMVDGLSVNQTGNLVVEANAFFNPRRPDGTRMTQVKPGGSPFDYTAEITPDLDTVVRTAAKGWK